MKLSDRELQRCVEKTLQGDYFACKKLMWNSLQYDVTTTHARTPLRQNRPSYFLEKKIIEQEQMVFQELLKHANPPISNPYAIAMLGLFYNYGWGEITVNVMEALRLYQLAGDKYNNPLGLHYLGQIYRNGWEACKIIQDSQKARDYYERALQQGFLFSQFYLSEMIRNGEGMLANPQRADELLHLAAQKGDPTSCEKLMFPGGRYQMDNIYCYISILYIPKYEYKIDMTDNHYKVDSAVTDSHTVNITYTGKINIGDPKILSEIMPNYVLEEKSRYYEATFCGCLPFTTLTPRDLACLAARDRMELFIVDMLKRADKILDQCFEQIPISFAPPPVDTYSDETERLRLHVRELELEMEKMRMQNAPQASSSESSAKVIAQSGSPVFRAPPSQASTIPQSPLERPLLNP